MTSAAERDLSCAVWHHARTTLTGSSYLPKPNNHSTHLTHHCTAIHSTEAVTASTTPSTTSNPPVVDIPTHPHNVSLKASLPTPHPTQLTPPNPTQNTTSQPWPQAKRHRLRHEEADRGIRTTQIRPLGEGVSPNSKPDKSPLPTNPPIKPQGSMALHRHLLPLEPIQGHPPGLRHRDRRLRRVLHLRALFPQGRPPPR